MKVEFPSRTMLRQLTDPSVRKLAPDVTIVLGYPCAAAISQKQPLLSRGLHYPSSPFHLCRLLMYSV